ncbi:MAG: hypothetical protein HZA91_02670 [Verrucomicrobia bacterium]|nr:hypothetical protein [Verrucomicrobiota bacterium]
MDEKNKMGWLSKLLGATPKEELDGINLDTHRVFWELDGKTDFPNLFRALADFLPDGSVLYFEGGSPKNELLAFLNAHAIPEETHVAVSVLWPKPVYYHIPATRKNLARLAELSEHCAAPELGVHFHVYCENKILLEWHDAFGQPMLLSGDIPEDKVINFAQVLSMKTTKWKNAGEQEH